MRQKLYLFIVSFLLAGAGSQISAQEQQNIVPVSPEAAAFSKMVNYPVNKNTGIPDISLPFYEVETGDLALPVNLVYHGGGFKINEQATRAGLGWSLSTNLQITRTINGLDDFKPGVGYMDNSLMKSYNSSSPYTGSYFYQGDPQNWYRDEYDLASGIKDGAPDKFNYRLLGKSGSFYFRRNASGSGYSIVPVPYEDIKITFDNGQFVIVDSDGTTYYFGEQGSGDLNDMQDKGKEVTGNIDGFGTCANCQVTAWKCVRIESSTSTNTIEFSYQPQSLRKYRTYNDRIEFFHNTSPCSMGEPYYHSDADPLSYYNSYENILQNIPFYRISSPKYMIYYANGQPVFHVPSFDTQKNMTDKTYDYSNYYYSNSTDIAGLVLSEITFRGGKVRFNGADKLNSIEVVDDQNHIVKALNLFQSYTSAVYEPEAKHYNGTGFQGTSYLDSVHIRNGQSTYESYAFLYNDKFCYGNHLKGHDAWGYPNGSTVEIAYANSGMGNAISIPTKDLLLNRFYFSLQGGCVDFAEDVALTLGGDNWAEAPDEGAMKKGTLKRIIYPTGGYTDFDWEANQYLELFNSGYGYLQDLPQLSGGLRIRSINYFDGKSLIPKKQKYYRYGEFEDGNGILINSPRKGLEAKKFHYEALAYKQQKAYLQAPGGPPGCNQTGCLSFKTIEDKTTYEPASALDYTYESGAPIYYTKVSIYERELGTQLGKTVHEYYPPNEFMPFDAIHDNSRIEGTPLQYLKTDGLMSAPKSISQYGYDSIDGYYLLHKKDFEYDAFLKDDWIRVAYSFFHVLYEIVEGNYTNSNPWELYNQGYSIIPPNLEGNFYSGEYCIAVGKLLLKKEKEQTFEGGNVLTQTTTYHYDHPSYWLPTRIVTSTSETGEITKSIKYPFDFTGIYNQMTADHMIDVPVEVTKTISFGNTELSRERTNYDYISNGWGFFAPVSLQSSYHGADLVTEVTFDQYDQYGNVLQRTQKDGIPVSYLWGYNSLYPVAELQGVKYDQIPSSFLNNVQINQPSGDAALRSLLDNLRNSFSGQERVNTYTYKRLIGMTSNTDASSSTTYYEYDPIGRLVTQKDDEQHVLQHYDYHLKGPSPEQLIQSYVNYPMMETYNVDCGGGDYIAYNYVVQGGKHVGSSQAMADYSARSDLKNNYLPPYPTPCSVYPPATASVTVRSYYYSLNGVFPEEVIVDFIQDESIVASCDVPFNEFGQQTPLQEKQLHLPPGEYQISFRPSANTHYSDGFTSYHFHAIDDQQYFGLYYGDQVTIEDGKNYMIEVDYEMFD